MAEDAKKQEAPKMVQMTKSTALITVPVELVPVWEKDGFVVVKEAK